MLNFETGAFSRELGVELSLVVGNDGPRYPISAQDKDIEEVKYIFLRGGGEWLGFDLFGEVVYCHNQVLTFIPELWKFSHEIDSPHVEGSCS